MRDLKRHRSARILALPAMPSCRVLCRGHYHFATDAPARHKLRTIFDELALAI